MEGTMQNQLTSQLQEQLLNMKKEEVTRRSVIPDTSIHRRLPAVTPTKERSRAQSSVVPSLSPSPKFREPAPKSKDDCSIDPRTPGRPLLHARGLSLQMPPREVILPASANFQNRVPLSPQLDARSTYGGSPTSVLPRHSRGLDFSRACTNLHHSTLAEQSSPDSSPTISQKGLMVPPRKPVPTTLLLDPLTSGSALAWATTGAPDKHVPPGSVGSISMMGSGSSSSSSGEDELMEAEDEEDPILSTPQVSKPYGYGSGTPFGNASMASPGAVWTNSFSPAAASLMNFQRRKYRKNKSEKSSSSASGHSTFACQSPASPSVTKSVEFGGYFSRNPTLREARSRRESLSMGTLDLHISSGHDSGDENRPVPSTPGVIRRAVTRRSNLLPKTKNFARVRAALLEEVTPVDSEARREADVVRQVRESDFDHAAQTTPASPGLPPTLPTLPDSLEDIPEDNALGLSNTGLSKTRSLSSTLSRQVSRNSAGPEFWNDFNRSMRTPPPPLFFPRGSSSGISDDINMDSPSVSTPPSSLISNSVPPNTGNEEAQSSTPQGSALPSAAEITRRINNKRRRDDDFDDMSLKRRAVSPGLSAHNSPVLAQSPAHSQGNWWGAAKAGREGSISTPAYGERSNSSSGSMNGATPGVGPKRVGLQGMTDTNDGLMKMSID